MPVRLKDDLLDLTEEIETECACPYCGQHNLIAFDTHALIFLCMDCGNYVHFDKDKNVIKDD